MHILITICKELGIPLASEKQDGPTAVITLIGIIIDTIRGELRLPEDKLQRLLQTVKEWEQCKMCTCRELESLIGVLQHAARVIKPGRSFLGRVISLPSVAKQCHHHIQLNAEFRSDMTWWRIFERAKELIPIVIGAVVWGRAWKGSRIVAYCDNTAVVAVLHRQYCQDMVMMQLLRCLFFVRAHFQFQITALHVPGLHNDLADDLSRNHLLSLLNKKPDASTVSSVIPSSLLQ